VSRVGDRPRRRGRGAGRTPADGAPAVAAPTARGEETRTRIVETALRLFRERGYDETTMRLIAEEAGVALGNAYYYFRSKDHLIQEYYARSHEEHERASEPALSTETDFKKRLRAVMHARVDVSEPYHRFAAALFRTAADPENPLSPFNEASRPVRERSTALLARVVDGSKLKVPDDLRAELPRLLWLYEMGIVLFWIHDRSPERRRTRRLVDRSVDLVARLVALASNPLLRPVRRTALRMVKEVEGEVGGDRPDADDADTGD
jgi:AcrR family transcriptional regulator